MKLLSDGPKGLPPELGSTATLNELMRRHLIEQLSNGTCSIEIPLVREWVKGTYG